VPAAVLRIWQDTPPGWDALCASDASASVGHVPALWRALLDTLPGCALRVVGLESGGAAIAGTPLLVQRRAGFHWLHALPFLLPAAPVAAGGAHADVDARVAEGIADLQRTSAAVGGAWACYRPGAAPPDAAALGATSGVTRTLACAVIDLTRGTEPALRAMDRKERQALHRARAGLEIREEPTALAAAYALHVRQARAWPGHRPPPLELSRRLLEPRGAEPAARLFACRDGGGLLSAVLVLDAPHECLLWWSGTHPEGRRRSAFGVLAWSVVEWAAARGRVRVNLGASTGLEGVASFKHSLGASTVSYPVRWLDARHAPLAGRWVAALQERVRRGRPRGNDA